MNLRQITIKINWN